MNVTTVKEKCARIVRRIDELPKSTIRRTGVFFPNVRAATVKVQKRVTRTRRVSERDFELLCGWEVHIDRWSK